MQLEDTMGRDTSAGVKTLKINDVPVNVKP